jgi:hypothetical protein
MMDVYDNGEEEGTATHHGSPPLDQE